jgi:hypothetical protein
LKYCAAIFYCDIVLLQVPGVENVELSDLIPRHMAYGDPVVMERILGRLGLEK